MTALVVLDADPVLTLPGTLGFAPALAKAGWSAYAGVGFNETAARCRWRLPLNHPLEDWSDLRGAEGTTGLVQPLIAPLHDTRSRHELMAILAGEAGASAYDILRATWAGTVAPDAFEEFWLRALHDGVVPGTPPEDAAPPAPAPVSDAVAAAGYELVLRPSPTLWIGETATNAWLQETPEPFTKQVWGNALWMAPEDAAAQGLADGDLAEVRSPSAS